MIQLLVIILALMQMPSVDGWASQYAPGVMEYPVSYHGYDYNNGNYVAVADCSLIGEYVLLRPSGGEWELHRVADCAGNDGTPTWMLNNNIITEISHETATRWGTIGQGVRVECKGCK